MAPTFRQVGYNPTQNRQALLKIQKSLEALVNRRASNSRLLQTLQALLQQTELQQPALLELRLQLKSLYNTVENGLFFHQPNNGNLKTALRLAHRTVMELVRRPQHPQPTVNYDKNQYQRFLDNLAAKGWGVPEEETETEQDGFNQSIALLNRLSTTTTLLPPDQEYGYCTASILLLHPRAIPESVLTNWSNIHDIYIVFGRYCCLVDVPLLGIKSSLVLMDTKQAPTIDAHKFEVVNNHLCRELKKNTNLILSPKVSKHHHYCPCPSIPSSHDIYFTDWDIIKG